MKRGIIIALFLVGMIIGSGYGSAKAADVEVILGTSSGFKIAGGTSVSAGTSAFFVGSSTVSIGTTTQAAMLTIAGSSTSGSEISLNVKNSSGADALFVRNDGAILIGTDTSNLNSAIVCRLGDIGKFRYNNRWLLIGWYDQCKCKPPWYNNSAFPC